MDIIKEMTNQKMCIKADSGCIDDADGTLLLEKDEITERWREYLSNHYSHDNRLDCVDLLETEGPSILKKAVIEAINRSKHGKAPGIDDITGELLLVLDEDGIEIITTMLRYETGRLPEDMGHSIVQIPKKLNVLECSDYLQNPNNNEPCVEGTVADYLEHE